MANISDFKAQLTGGGARANQFRVELAFPTYVSAGPIVGMKTQFLCKSAQLPASTIDNVPLQYRGRAVNIAGERTFAPWTISVYNDTDFAIRNALEQWSNGVQNLSTSNGRVNPRDYQVDLMVHQLDRNGAIVKTYKFIDAWPSEVGAIALDFDTANAVETFDTTFTYNYWTSDTAEQGGFGVNVSIDTPIGSFPIGG
jgi:hypothetical protein